MGMQYPSVMDPLDPQVDINDYIRLLTQQIGSDTITYASGTASTPSKASTTVTMPRVGILSRLLLDFTGTFTFTAGGGSGAVAADGRGPFQIVNRITLTVNGSAAWYNVSGWGSYLLMAAEEATAFPVSAPGATFASAPRNVTGTIYNYPVNATGAVAFGIEVPLILRPDQPLGMLLLQNDQTTVALTITWGNLDAYAALTGGASATLSLSVNVVMEYFDQPEEGAFQSFFVPMLEYGHWFNEETQSIVAQGRDANIYVADNHDTYLKLLHTVMLNGVIDTDHVTGVRLVLNRNTTLYDHNLATQLRRQRRQISKDLPMVGWNLFSRGRLRDALHADLYTDIRSVIDISGATLGTNPQIITTTEKLVYLGPAGAAVR